MSLYLSRLFLNDRDRQAAQDLRSAYSFHQTIRWAYPRAGEPHAPLPEGERILWRGGAGYLGTKRDPPRLGRGFATSS